MAEKSPFAWSTFWQGFRAGAPMWFAAAPFALAYVGAARDAGFSAIEIQLMSLTVYAAATQIVVAQAFAHDIPTLTLFITVCAMNIHHLLYGLSLKKELVFTRVQRLCAAFPLTDFAFGAALMRPRNTRFSFLLGAEMSVYLVWNLYTGVAIVLQPVLYSLKELRLDFIIPLTFWGLLISAIKGQHEIAVAVFSIGLAAVGYALGLGSVVVPVVGLVGSLLGAGLVKLSASESV